MEKFKKKNIWNSRNGFNWISKFAQGEKILIKNGKNEDNNSEPSI